MQALYQGPGQEDEDAATSVKFPPTGLEESVLSSTHSFSKLLLRACCVHCTRHGDRVVSKTQNS